MITNISPSRKRWLDSLWMACLFSLALIPSAVLFAQTKSQTKAKDVPAAVLKRMLSQYVPYDDHTQGLTEIMKLRRYKAILSEGAFTEQRFAGAANLHELRHLMLLAAKGKAALEGTPEAGRLLMAIAERLAQSSAPPDKRLPAELLLVRSKLDELSNAPAEVSDELDVMVARYADTPAAAQALRGAAELAETGGVRTSARKFLKRLASDHVAKPGVRELLTWEGEEKAAYFSRLFTTSLTLLDGNEIILPRDTLGKPTLLHFWTIEQPGLLAAPGPGSILKSQNMIRFADIAKDYPTLNIIGINLDTNRTAVQRFIDEKGISWPIAFSGLGWSDPFLKTYSVAEVPAYWLIGPDGRSYERGVSATLVPKGSSVWGSYNSLVRQQLDLLGEGEARAPYYRSGAFLLDIPDLLPIGRLTAKSELQNAHTIPVAELEAMYDLLFQPSTLGLTEKQKAVRMRKALEQGWRIEKTQADANGLWQVRAWMLVASRWLATQKSDMKAAEESYRLAHLLQEEETSAIARLLGDYVCLSHTLQAKNVTLDTAGTRIDTFLQSWNDTDLKWAAEILAVILATESSDEQTRIKIMRGFVGDRWKMQPKLRGFLRDYCHSNIDASKPLFERNGFGSYGGSAVLPTEPMPVVRDLPRLGGSIFRLPKDAGRKFVIIQFWSIAAPPEKQSLSIEDNSQRASDLAKEHSEIGNALWDKGKTDEALEYYQKAIDVRKRDISSDFIDISVNLDDSRTEVEKFLIEHPEFNDSTHIFSGKGWRDPLARELDIYNLPRAVLLNRDGLIERWAAGGLFDAGMLHSLTTKAQSPERSVQFSNQARVTENKNIHQRKSDIQQRLSLDLGEEQAIELLLVGPGEFAKGSTSEEMEQHGDESPRRQVRLTKPWYMAVHPVTRAQFATFIKQSGYITEAEREGHALIWTDKGWQRIPGANWANPGFEQDDNHPVVCVSFNDANKFCQWLSEKTGRDVRLPTDAQWEFSCRAGGTTRYPWGDQPGDAAGFANLADRVYTEHFPHLDVFEFSDEFAYTSPVGQYKSNFFGLHDMSGNVWEWTADWIDLSYILKITEQYWGELDTLLIDPVGPARGEYKVTRGGSWHSDPADSRSASQRIAIPTMRNNILGFRISVGADASMVGDTPTEPGSLLIPMTDPGAPDLGQVRINPKEPSLRFPVTVNQRNGPVERPLVTD